MSGFLDGGIADTFAAIFSGVYLSATLHRPTTTDDGTGGGSTTWANEPIKVQPDAVIQAMVSGQNYVESDGRMLMLASGHSDPDTDCELTYGSTRFMVVNWSTDPCRSYFDLHVRKA